MNVRRDDKSSGYIVRKSLGPKELLPTLLGYVRTVEFRWVISACLITLFVTWADEPVWAFFIALATLVACVYQTYGKTMALSLHLDNGTRVGGMRIKYSRWRKVVLIAGIYVEPEHRRKGGSALLLYETLMLSLEFMPEGGKVVMYNPTHPASKLLASRYNMPLDIGSIEYSQALEQLALARQSLQSNSAPTL